MGKYNRVIKGVTVDVYDVLRAYDVRSPAIQRAIKKLLMPGQRGAKTELEDIIEAEFSVSKEVEFLTEKLDQENMQRWWAIEGVERNFQLNPQDFDLIDVTLNNGQVFEKTEPERWTFGGFEELNVAKWRPHCE